MQYKFNFQATQLVDHIWSTSSIIRHFLKFENIYLLNYLLYLKFKGVFEAFNTSQNASELFYQLNQWSHSQDYEFREIADIYNNILYLLPKDSQYSILHMFKSIDYEITKECFIPTFELLLDKITSENGKRGGIFFQPRELSELMLALLKVEEGLIYNPFAGISSLSIGLPPTVNYYGQEKDRTTWALGNLRILAHNLGNQAVLKCESSISGWLPNHSNKTPNYIVGTPPFNIKLQPDQIYYLKTSQKTYESYFIESTIRSLSANGKAVIAVSKGILTSKGPEEELRKKIVEDDILELIVSFPGGIFQNTSIPFTLLCFNKKKPNKGEFTFIDCDQLVSRGNSKQKIINVNEILELVDGKIQNSNKISTTIKKIEFENFNLDFKRYSQLDQPIDPNTKSITLSSVTEIINHRKSNNELFGKYIRIRDLQSDPLNNETSFKEAENMELPKFCTKIAQDVVLVASRWKNLKPTKFRYVGEAIYISNDIIALNYNESKIDPYYLVHELSSAYIQDQVFKYQTGSTVPGISKSDFHQILINVPNFESQQSIEIQKTKIQWLKEAYIEQRQKELSLEKEILGVQERSFKNTASVIHTLRQYLNALKSNVGGTLSFLQNNSGANISLDTMYSNKLNKTFGEQLFSLQATIDEMTTLIRSLDSSEPQVLFEPNSLKKLTEDAQLMFENKEHFKFDELYFESESFFNEDDEFLPIVKISKENFNKVFLNIIDNAIKHGFKKKNKDYFIRTSIFYDAKNEECVLHISNNGDPVDDQFTFEHFIIKGEKTSNSLGTGMGGYDIYNIIQKHNGSVNWIIDKDNEFSLTVEIRLPLFKDLVNEN